MYVLACIYLNQLGLYRIGLYSKLGKCSWSKITQDFLNFSGTPKEFYNVLQKGNIPAQKSIYSEALKTAVTQVEEWYSQSDYSVITAFDNNFPKGFLNIPEIPPFLFCKGNFKDCYTGMSIIGVNKEMSDESIELAMIASDILKKHNLTHISGLALGVDETALETSLQFKRETVGFLPVGVNNISEIPTSNYVEKILDNNGFVLSQFYPNTGLRTNYPLTNTYYKRSSLMSGYGICTIAIESSEYCSTRHQVTSAVNQNRPVILTKQIVKDTYWGEEYAKRYKNIHVAKNRKKLEEKILKICKLSSITIP